MTTGPRWCGPSGRGASLGPDVVIPALDNDSTVAAVVGAAIAAGVTRMIRHDPGVRLGDDPEHVHQARVGTRRLRSDLRTFSRLLDPDWGRPIRDELGWLGAALGEVRDADVLTGRLRRQIRTLAGVDAKAAAALLRRLAIQRDEARVRLLQALDSDRYLLLLENLTQAAAHPPLTRPRADLTASNPAASNPTAAELNTSHLTASHLDRLGRAPGRRGNASGRRADRFARGRGGNASGRRGNGR